jgi:hypothetical protein
MYNLLTSPIPFWMYKIGRFEYEKSLKTSKNLKVSTTLLNSRFPRVKNDDGYNH